MKLSTFNALFAEDATAPARGSFVVVPTDTVEAYFTEGGETAVSRGLAVFSAGTVRFIGADGTTDTWTLGAGFTFPVTIPVAVKQVLATGTTVAAGGIRGLDTITGTAAGVAVPANTVLPAITGNTTEGETLTASTGTWSNSPTGYSYQWKRGVTNVGADQNTYVLVAGDVGSTMTVVVTASNAAGSANATSTATATIASASGYTPSLVYSDSRNSMYVGAGF